MANTIGKDKRPASSGRSGAAARVKATGVGVSKQTAPTKAAPVDQDVAVAEVDDVESDGADEALDLTATDDENADGEYALVSSDLAVSRSSASSVAHREPAPARSGFLGFILRFLLLIPGARFVAASAQELRKVTAPTPREAWNMTLLVIAMSAVLALLLGAADLVLIQGLQWVVHLGTGK